MPRYYMLNKPRGCVTACSDRTQRTVMDLLPQEAAYGLHPIGRLDLDTTGLLLLTDDGALTHALMQPKHTVRKIYEFTAIGVLTSEAADALQKGVPLDQQGTVSRPAKIEVLRTMQVSDILEDLPQERRERYLKNPSGAAFLGRITLTEGKKHEVKRLLRAVHCRVCGLKRIAVGGVTLDESLPLGGYRPLTEEEITLLCQYK
ncbi:MAG: pseudouridine synthase [Oscillospiraceae bacterium]|nr:pseudouridine synthase [Oscillospiraceae bacterium]